MAVDAVMFAISEIAARDGVSKQAVSRKVKQLVEKHGLTVERNDLGRVTKVNVAEYDHLRGRFDDPSKTQAPRPSTAVTAEETKAPASNSYDEALRQKTWIEAERARLRLEEEMRLLVPADQVVAAAEACGDDVKAITKRITNFADDLGAAFERDGAHGLRVALKQIADRQCHELADAFERLAAAGRATTTTTSQASNSDGDEEKISERSE